MKAMDKRLVARLVESGHASAEDLNAALEQYDGRGGAGDFLIRRGLVQPAAMAQALAEINGFEFVRLDEIHCEPEAIALLDREEAWRLYSVPVRLDGDVLTVALQNPNDVYTPDHLRLRLKRDIRVLVAEREDLLAALRQLYGNEPGQSRDQAPLPGMEEGHREYQRKIRQMRTPDEAEQGISRLDTKVESDNDETTASLSADRSTAPEPSKKSAGESPGSAKAFEVLRLALEKRAQDMEVSPTGDKCQVRFRTGIQWVPGPSFAAREHEELLSGFFAIAGLQGEEQDISGGRHVLVCIDGSDLQCRMQTVATRDGRRLTIRLPEPLPLLANPLLDLGLPATLARDLDSRLRIPNGGLLLLSGPRARTLERIYSALLFSLGHAGSRDVVSLEAVQSWNIPGVTCLHCQNEESLLMDLENALAMEPDIVGVQDIPGAAPLSALVKAALRGSTTLGCYTAQDEDSAAAVFAAAGIEPMNLVRAITGIVYIREARRLCVHCRRSIDDRDALPGWALHYEGVFYEAPGCDECNGTGGEDVVAVTSFLRPDRQSAAGGFETAVSRETSMAALALAGEIDPRDRGAGL